MTKRCVLNHTNKPVSCNQSQNKYFFSFTYKKQINFCFKKQQQVCESEREKYAT